jgi:CubicO group peptidase (beta-lactamase class C family)
MAGGRGAMGTSRPTLLTLRRTTQLIENGIAEGLHLGAQLYVSVEGKPVAELAIGESRPGVTMTPDTLSLWLSAGKPVTAVAIAQQVERGRVSIDDPVAKHVPEFAQRGKERITIRHLLTHTGGFRGADLIPEDLSWHETIERICAATVEPDWVIGEKAGYQLSSSWFVLAEIVRRLSGRAYSDYVRDEIFVPLGMRASWIGMPLTRHREYGERIGFIYLLRGGKLAPHAEWNSEADCTRCRPGGNARGPVRELGKFYESLLGFGAQLLKKESVAEFTRRHRIGMFDHTFQHVIDFGLGFIVNSNRYGVETVPYGYGRHASEETFGHSGAQSSCAFADPARQLVVAWSCNGLPGERLHQRRAREINAAIYEDLGLL